MGTHWWASSSSGTFQPRLAWLANVPSCANLTKKTWRTSLSLVQDDIGDETQWHWHKISMVTTHSDRVCAVSCHSNDKINQFQAVCLVASCYLFSFSSEVDSTP